jgi:hypothetical protein
MVTEQPTDRLFLPEKDNKRIVCGVTIVEWHFAVVYVHQEKKQFEPPTQMYFTFYGSGDYRLDEIAQLVDQWTFRRGACLYTVPEGSHEYYRAKQMACKTVGTYRRRYLSLHGQPPNPLCLTNTLDEDLVKQKMRKFCRKPFYGQQFVLELDDT